MEKRKQKYCHKFNSQRSQFADIGIFTWITMRKENLSLQSSGKRKLTGTAQIGTVLSFKGYLRSDIISFPTKR